MNIKFTTTQRSMLCVAAQREDRCLAPSVDLKGSAARVFTTKLIDAGLAREIRAKDEFPVWRMDKIAGQNCSLKLTAAGIKAAVETQEVDGPISEAAPAHLQPLRKEASKLSKVILMLSQDEGITVQEISKAMGWLPHTTRAALTGLRKRGVTIVRDKILGKRGSSYRIEATAKANSAA
jgi:hypothetical protein